MSPERVAQLTREVQRDWIAENERKLFYGPTGQPSARWRAEERRQSAALLDALRTRPQAPRYVVRADALRNITCVI